MDVETRRESKTPERNAATSKRRREDKERRRVTRACDRCKKRKTRCTGVRPCPLCIRDGLVCEFTASYSRGRLPPVVVDRGAMAAMNRRTNLLPLLNSPTTDSGLTVSSYVESDMPTEDRSTTESRTVPNKETPLDQAPRSSPEPTQTDRQGHYIGSSSGVSFLLRVQRKLHENNSLSYGSSIFAFGDAPLPEFDPTFFVLPPKAEGERLVARYFDFASPTHRFLHRATIEGLLHEFYDTQGDMRNKDEAASKTALLLLVFAEALANRPSVTAADDNSARYYFAAEHQLAKEKGAVRLASVQARLAQCYYLLSQSRINQCWSLFGTMAHLAFAIGLNRGRRADPNGRIDYIELECRRRTFWSAYVLDKFMAGALGRPRTFRDEDIDQDLPAIVNDELIHQHGILPAPPSASYIPSVMVAPVGHIRLARIISYVLHDLYPIRPPSFSQRLILATKYSQELREWRSSVSHFLLDTQNINSSLYQSQRNVLNLNYYHTVLLVYRPFLLGSFASLAGDARTAEEQADNRADVQQNVKECLSAAMGIVRIVDEIFSSGMMLRSFWFTQYHAFCAVVVLYIGRIQQRAKREQQNERTGDERTFEAAVRREDDYFAAAQQCQSQLETLSDTDCMCKRYVLVLEKMRMEAARADNAGVGPAQRNAQLSMAPAAPTAQNPAFQTSGLMPVDGALQAAPHPGFYPNVSSMPENASLSNPWLATSSLMDDLTNWGQFDSLVTSGFGDWGV